MARLRGHSKAGGHFAVYPAWALGDALRAPAAPLAAGALPAIAVDPLAEIAQVCRPPLGRRATKRLARVLCCTQRLLLAAALGVLAGSLLRAESRSLTDRAGARSAGAAQSPPASRGTIAAVRARSPRRAPSLPPRLQHLTVVVAGARAQVRWHRPQALMHDPSAHAMRPPQGPALALASTEGSSRKEAPVGAGASTGAPAAYVSQAAPAQPQRPAQAPLQRRRARAGGAGSEFGFEG
ncbi:MAG TPA: hypothetical protein VKU89_09745 [Solirubrobacteraceae bacterium]|nr:hypothetical protein [Solirubrobacteraceae bacterium]